MMGKSKVNIIQLILLFSITVTAKALVIKNDGPSSDAPSPFTNQYIPQSLTQKEMTLLASKVKKLQPISPNLFPLKTKRLHVCDDFQLKKNNRQMPFPVFIVGDDAKSMSWINRYKNILNREHAVGLVVSASNDASFSKIKNITGGMPVYPADGDAVSQFFSLRCYPVLISKHIIEQ